MKVCTLFGLCPCVWAVFQHMNGEYHFANQKPGTQARHRGSAYFDVYTDVIESQYSEVKWDAHTVPLDKDFVAKYDGKVISIVGMEFDIIRKNAAGDDVSVPSWEQYIHHYNNNLMGKGTKLIKTNIPSFHGGGCAEDHNGIPGHKLVYTGSGNPAWASQFLPMGNGAESRKTFKFFPPGYGALIESPTTFNINPMIIDTKNRNGTGNTPTRHGPVPANSNVGPDAMYNGIMECPCTDRYPKHISDFVTQNHGVCSQYVITPQSCFAAGAELGLKPVKENLTESSTVHPPGCHVSAVSGGFEVVFNSAESKVPCGATDATMRMVGSMESLVNVTVDMQPRAPAPAPSIVGYWEYVGGSNPNFPMSYGVDISVNQDTYVAQCVCPVQECSCWNTVSGKLVDGKLGIFPNIPGSVSSDNNMITFSNSVIWQRPADGTVKIELKGPSDVWFGVGFGATSSGGGESTGFSMAGTPWAIVVVDGKVEERKLGNHQPGKVLPATVTIQSNTVTDGQRTLVLTRSMRTGTFNFTSTSYLGMINAVGSSQTFGYHKAKATDTMYLIDVMAPTCICRDPSGQGTIGGFAWGPQRCLQRPLSQLMDDPKFASNDGINPTCLLKSYRGGLRCCHGNTILLDSNQTVPAEKDQYQLKFRHYYEELDDVSKVNDVYWTFWWTEYNNNEHDIPACQPGEDCVHVLSSNFTAGDMPGFNPVLGANGTTFIHMEGHCHIGCLKMELWIMDDPANPQLLCRTSVVYGTGDEAHNEMGYILGNEPCIFGREEDGFEAPIVLHANTKLMSLKYQNNTVGRYGDMALWEVEAAYVKSAVPEFFV